MRKSVQRKANHSRGHLNSTSFRLRQARPFQGFKRVSIFRMLRCYQHMKRLKHFILINSRLHKGKNCDAMFQNVAFQVPCAPAATKATGPATTPPIAALRTAAPVPAITGVILLVDILLSGEARDVSVVIPYNCVSSCENTHPVKYIHHASTKITDRL